MDRYRIFFVAGLLCSTHLIASEQAHWSYAGHDGPDHWGAISSDYISCSQGLNQSPIDLTGMVEGELPELSIKYASLGDSVVNNGHTIKVNYQPGSKIEIGDKTFELKQFHFHAPSENRIMGRSFPMEAHFVHSDKEGNLAVIAIMYSVGEQHQELEKAWAFMPEEAGKKNQLSVPVDAARLMSTNRDYYRFNGSLTTPPCTEGVEWYVMKSIQSVSKQQLDKFVEIMAHDNNRPIQPLNARIVVE